MLPPTKHGISLYITYIWPAVTVFVLAFETRYNCFVHHMRCLSTEKSHRTRLRRPAWPASSWLPRLQHKHWRASPLSCISGGLNISSICTCRFSTDLPTHHLTFCPWSKAFQQSKTVSTAFENLQEVTSKWSQSRNSSAKTLNWILAITELEREG
jgi:hypothetical protein